MLRTELIAPFCLPKATLRRGECAAPLEDVLVVVDDHRPAIPRVGP
jgi:hypothetical protein